MCYPAKCPACGQTTWDGCGQHADAVMNSVPQNQRCTCTELNPGMTSFQF
jgi:hypothetical protein